MLKSVNVSKKLKLKVSINENQVAGLKSGNTVAVTASVYPDTKFAGKIIHCSMADSSLNFPLEISTNSPSNDLKAGMYGTAVLLQNNKSL
jgi:multidrug resistance efflux pump